MASDSAPDSSKHRVFLTKQELVARSGLSAATIQRYKDKGRIPFYQPGGKGGRVLFPLDAIEAAHRELANSPAATADAAVKNTSKLPGPRPRWQTNLQTEMR